MESIAEIGVLQYLHHVDQAVTLAINSLNCPFTDRIWMLFSNREIWFPMYIIIAIFLFIRLGWKRATVVTIACILTVTACDQFGNFVKDAVQRLRPCWDLNMVNGGLHLLEGKGNLYGFYSAHAANTLGFAVCSLKGFKIDKTRSYKAYSICIVLWAFLVGMSRVFVGKHFFGDVCAGFIVGIIFGGVMAKIAELIINRIERKPSPSER